VAYRTHADISFCWIDDHLIFLDIESDRYFRLPDKLECAFVTIRAGGACDELDVQRLLASRILTIDTELENTAPTAIGPVHRSAIELFTDASSCSLGLLIEVAAIILTTRRQLATRPLKTILDRLATDRHARTSQSTLSDAPNSDHILIEAANIFRRARLYVPIPTRCLLDSISIVRFLARRRLPANIIFGVTCAPFSAHCWAQANDLVLNDSVGNVAAYTPIRVV
jgi:hypothetical protein